MKSKKGIFIGAIALIVVAGLAAVIAVPLILSMLFGGMMMNMGSAGIGALGNEHEEQISENQCLTPSGGAMTGSQEEYVRSVIGVAKDLDISEKGQIVAVMVMLQESGIQNYANSGENQNNFSIGTSQGTDYWLDVAKLSLDMPHDAVGNDADSVGLFQQRASAGWADTSHDDFRAEDDNEGAVERLMNPEFSARAFFGGEESGIANKGLLDIDGWEDLEPAVAAQKVQASAYPSAYEKWESEARSLVESNQDASTVSSDGTDSSDSDDDEESSEESSDSDSDSGSTFDMPLAEGDYTLTSPFGTRNNPVNGGREQHNGQDMRAEIGTPIHAVADGEVVAAGTSNGFGNWVVIDHNIDGTTYSSVYGHMPSPSINVSVGDEISSGDHIADVGNEGMSAGPHLHIEIWEGGRLSNGTAHDPMDFLDGEFSGSSGGGGSSGDHCGGTAQQVSSISASGDAEAVIAAGEEHLGVDYSWGGGTVNGPSEGFGEGAGISGFDCSSLVQNMVYNGTDGYELPRTSREQYQSTKGNTVAEPGDSEDNLEPGDILFYSHSGAENIHHVAMYVGDGQMIEAPETGDVVKITDVRIDNDTFLAATRIDYSEHSA